MRVLIFLCFNAVFALHLNAQTSKRLTQLPQELTEVSGMYIAAPDSIWWLNDGGNAPELYLTDRNGNLRRRLALPLPNRDWEELCADHAGNLYIGDFGNNLQARRDLCIFKLHLASMRIDSIKFSYAEQTAWPPQQANEKDFDCEAMVWQNGQLHLFSKCHYNANEFEAGHYVLPDQPGSYQIKRLHNINLPKQVITGASLSKDGKTLGLTSYLYKKHGKLYLGKSYLWLFDWQKMQQNGTVQLVKKRRLRGWITARQVESLGFFNPNQIWVASEKTPIQKQRVKRVRVKLK